MEKRKKTKGWRDGTKDKKENLEKIELPGRLPAVENGGIILYQKGGIVRQPNKVRREGGGSEKVTWREKIVV